MPLFGLVTAFLAFCYCELEGTRYTRPGTRLAFLGLLLTEWGLRVDPVVAGVGNLLGMIPI